MTMMLSLSLLFSLLFVLHPLQVTVLAGYITKNGDVCTVFASGLDDTSAVLAAFDECSHDSVIEFQNTTYHIEQVMETTGLQNVTVNLQGTLLWGTNISYWRNNSLPLGYQNQTTAWVFGGSELTFNGFGYGTFDGNGQLWYDYSNGIGNLAGRPISLTVAYTTNSTFTGLRFVQSQFWTMAITYSENILLEDIYVNSTSATGTSTENTDGCDTFYSNNLTFRRWDITNGDDNITPKANSTNILVEDSYFHSGNGIAIGSIGQYFDTFEYIENFTARNIIAENTLYAAYIKTWTGTQLGYPPNGGGGGLGNATNLLFTNFTLSNVSTAAMITQCTTYINAIGDCDTSTFRISNATWSDMKGTADGLAELQCSAAAPCYDIALIGFDQITTYNGTRDFACSNVESTIGFNCTQGLEP